MEVTTILCDVCGRAKSATNHWFVAVTQPPTPDAPGEEGIAFGPSGAEISPGMKREDICGQECAHKRLSQWLADPTALQTPKGDPHDH